MLHARLDTVASAVPGRVVIFPLPSSIPDWDLPVMEVGLLLNFCYSPVCVGDTQENWVAPPHSPSHHLKYLKLPGKAQSTKGKAVMQTFKSVFSIGKSLQRFFLPGTDREKWPEVKLPWSYPTLRLHELYSPWDSPGQNSGVGSHSLPNPGMEHRSPAPWMDSSPAEPPGKPRGALTSWNLPSKCKSLLWNGNCLVFRASPVSA